MEEIIDQEAHDDLEVSPSYLIYQHHVTDASTLSKETMYYSPTIQLHRLNWAISYKIVSLTDYTSDVFCLFLAFLGPERMAKIKAEVELQLIDVMDKSRSVKKVFSSFIDITSKRHAGFPKFMYWIDIINPERGFLVDDQIVLEVKFSATPPQPLFMYHEPPILEAEAPITVPTLIVRSEDDTTEACRVASEGRLLQHLIKQLTGCRLGSPLHITDRGQYLLSSGLGADYEFIVGEGDEKKTFKASSILLTRASPVFERMFFGDLPHPSPVHIPDVHPDTFYKLLLFAYGCHLNLESCEEAAEVFTMADKYLVEDLQNFALSVLWPKDEKAIWTALRVAEMYNLRKVEEAALIMAEKNPYFVVDHPEFAELTPYGLLAIVQLDELVLGSELLLFKAVLRWAYAQCERKDLPLDGAIMRREIGEAFHYIRFLAMSADEFAEDPVTCGMLTEEEQLQCLLTMVAPMQHTPPPTLCALRLKRGQC